MSGKSTIQAVCLLLAIGIWGCEDPNEPIAEEPWARIDKLSSTVVVVGDTVTISGSFVDYPAHNYHVFFRESQCKTIAATTTEISFVAPDDHGSGTVRLYRTHPTFNALDTVFVESEDNLLVVKDFNDVDDSIDTLGIGSIEPPDGTWSYSSSLKIVMSQYVDGKHLLVLVDDDLYSSREPNSPISLYEQNVSLIGIPLSPASNPKEVVIIDAETGARSRLPYTIYETDSIAIENVRGSNNASPGDRLEADGFELDLTIEFNGVKYDPRVDPGFGIKRNTLIIENCPDFERPGAMLRFIHRNTGLVVAQGWVERAPDSIVVPTNITWMPSDVPIGQHVEFRFDPSINGPWDEWFTIGSVSAKTHSSAPGKVKATLVNGIPSTSKVRLYSRTEGTYTVTIYESLNDFTSLPKELPPVPYAQLEVELELPCTYLDVRKGTVQEVLKITSSVWYRCDPSDPCDTLLTPTSMAYVYQLNSDDGVNSSSSISDSHVALGRDGSTIEDLDMRNGSSSSYHRGSDSWGTKYSISGVSLPMQVSNDTALVVATGRDVFDNLDFDWYRRDGKRDGQTTHGISNVVPDPENAHLTKLTIRLMNNP